MTIGRDIAKDDRAEIIQRYKDGASMSQLVIDYCVSRDSIKRLLVATGVQLRNRSFNGRNPRSHIPHYLPTPEQIEEETAAIRNGAIPGFPGWSESERQKRTITTSPPARFPKFYICLSRQHEIVLEPLS